MHEVRSLDHKVNQLPTLVVAFEVRIDSVREVVVFYGFRVAFKVLVDGRSVEKQVWVRLF